MVPKKGFEISIAKEAQSLYGVRFTAAKLLLKVE
jgi:hypothetical protein